jgi:tRNA pseudouridine55 synthase
MIKGRARPAQARPERRDISGILLLDKPEGLTSNAALQEVKRLYQARKAGHTGSLDPLASGLLPICLGEATKLSGYLLNADKTYRFVCRLGITTTTGDAEGEVLETRPVAGYTPAQVSAVLDRFVGTIEQLPPMYSALKIQGKRLYELARQGIEVERAVRTVTIHELRLLGLAGERLECEVRCSKGTYIRTLAEDIGAALGCGAHVAALRRTAVAPYDAARMVPLAELRARAERSLTALDELLLAPDSALADWPLVRLSDDAAYYLRAGSAVRAGMPQAQGWVRLYDASAHFLGIGEVLPDGRVAPRRLLHSP